MDTRFIDAVRLAMQLPDNALLDALLAAVYACALRANATPAEIGMLLARGMPDDDWHALVQPELNYALSPEEEK